MRAGRSVVAAVGVTLLGPAWGAEPDRQTTGVTNPPLVMSSMYGRDLYDFYCASCHGRDGKGHGPTAPALKRPPPDLTTMARSLAGSFPTSRVEALITDGGTSLLTPAHGSKDMPVWGPIFRALDARDELAAVRISNVVAYLESIQAK